MDEIWVPGAWAEQIARECGVQRPIQIIPAGIDPDFLHPDICGRRIDQRFVLLAHHTGGDCAALERLLRAYARAFRPGNDTVLLLRIFGLRRDPAAVAGLRKQLQSATIAPVAVLIDQEVPAYQVGAIYRSADCFVAPACGGMQLSILEAMACGLPVIAADCGGAHEYMAGGLGYPVRTSGATADEDHLAELLRYVYEHHTEARIVGQRAALAAAARTWDRAAEAVLEYIIRKEN
jgi:glycosyltransferase involved in cell wall biosynthesis